MHLMSLKEVQKCELYILIYIDKICRKHNINYALASGTLLGAVRHKGFIPWDNDIDITMLRGDYERFKSVMLKENDEQYKLFSLYVQDDYDYPFVKVVDSHTVLKEKASTPPKGYGLFVDVFPLDVLPDDEKKRQRLWKFCRFLMITRSWLMNVPFRDIRENPVWWKRWIKTFFYFPRHFVGFIIGQTTITRLMMKLMVHVLRSYKSSMDDPEVAAYTWCGPCTTMNESWMKSPVQMDFEGHNFLVMKEWKTRLTREYGDDFMTPPPEHLRRVHDMIAYIKEDK